MSINNDQNNGVEQRSIGLFSSYKHEPTESDALMGTSEQQSE